MMYWILEWKSRRYPDKRYVMFTFTFADFSKIKALLDNIPDYHMIVEQIARI